jgi:hypothetical protein
MELTITIPDQAEGTLRQAFGENLSRAALEAMAIEGYRSGKLSAFEVQTLLDLENRWETEAWLARHHVHLNYDWDDVVADRATLDRVLGPEKQ